MARDGYESDRQRLCCYDLQTGEKKYLTESFDSNVDDFVWSDNKDAFIYFIGVWHATENLYAINWKGEVKQLTNDWADFGSLQMLGNKTQQIQMNKIQLDKSKIHQILMKQIRQTPVKQIHQMMVANKIQVLQHTRLQLPKH
jgi:hypothetical protein